MSRTLLPIDNSLVLLGGAGCHGNRLDDKPQEGVVGSVRKESPELARILSTGGAEGTREKGRGRRGGKRDIQDPR